MSNTDSEVKINVRFAQPGDCEAIHRYITELAVYEKEPQAVDITVDNLIHDGFHRDPPLYKSFVAEIEGKVVGFCLFFYRYSTWKGKSIYLEDLYVSPDYRRLGVGQHLFKALASWAVSDGCRRLTWQVLSWNEPAISFYKGKLDAKIDPEWSNGELADEDLKRVAEGTV